MAAEDPAQALFRPGPSLGLRCRPVQQLEEAQVAQTFDAPAVRTWCGLALRALGRAREEIDAINVYPVADGDTGTNLYLTVESAVAAVEAVFAAHETGAGVSDGLPGGDRAGIVEAGYEYVQGVGLWLPLLPEDFAIPD
ncbi:hypothetical protein ABZ651_34530, partial [Streptomyces sp. NPDC007070]